MLSGALPASLSNLTHLNSLRFHLNKDIRGPLPKNLGDLSSMKVFIGAENSLTGPIPWSTFPLNSQLVEWNVEENVLGGSFPSNIGSLFPSLESLNLRNNQISGTLPISLFEMNKTRELILQGNALIGTIPMSISNMVSLTALDLSDNRLFGTMPTELGLLEDLGTFFYGCAIRLSLPLLITILSSYRNSKSVTELTFRENSYRTWFVDKIEATRFKWK